MAYAAVRTGVRDGAVLDDNVSARDRSTFVTVKY